MFRYSTLRALDSQIRSQGELSEHRLSTAGARFFFFDRWTLRLLEPVAEVSANPDSNSVLQNIVSGCRRYFACQQHSLSRQSQLEQYTMHQIEEVSCAVRILSTAPHAYFSSGSCRIEVDSRELFEHLPTLPSL